MLPGNWRSMLTLYCTTCPCRKSRGWKKYVPVKVDTSGGVLKIGNPLEMLTILPPGPQAGVLPDGVETGHPPNWKMSPSAKKGGFCQRPCAPWLQAESWEMEKPPRRT